ncbi:MULTISPECIES: zinc-dependent alcohol dehydrogenase [Methylobacillus]|uniref:Glutathione-independent formaldehyde dehydrogenase n=1 Tax=Methylobacillus flagellatus (strain ATCC 51484 / DSM 6875 / VKM B-1610 / KT) TaxID=265072 RepID=Q1H1C8_METFK|nr:MULTISPECIES: zinc-dependent alcohol dehydrogenase [Methylobacillus]ABE49709.1 glutathione-independent formaldehyde dehydrogenase [Methylobacillus flagellatus KT]MPS49054.1 glutathione-dependent formaldehyde dehydrogenase [Methylobacillus sp.]
MRALTYHGSKDVRIETVPDPVLQADDDIIIRVTSTAICGSDLHLYRGKIPQLHDGDILGHEFMGIVEDTGHGVTEVRKGDRVIIPFVIACGHCFFCAQQQFAACETTNPGPGPSLNKKSGTPPAALFGYSHLYGGIPGGQAELVRVPHGNVGPFKINGSLADEQVLFLTDILPTGYQAVLNAGVGKGSSLAIFGAGPVGLMAAACARMMGVETIFMIDDLQYRLDFAQAQYNTISINLDEVEDPADYILEHTAHRGVDGSIDAVGFEAKGSVVESALTALKLETSNGKVIRQCIAATRRGGTVSIPGVYAGFIHGFLIGDAFDKGLTFKMGQTHVHRFLPELLEFIENGDLHPADIITHRMALEDAPLGYRIFNDAEENCRKVVLTPGLH